MQLQQAVRLATILSTALVAQPAFAHSEREIVSPVRPGPVPDINRVNPNRIVVCKSTSQPTAAQLTEIQAREATATGDALVQAQAEEAAWHRNTALFSQCCFEHIQEAVNAAGDNTDILVMPGIYREEPSRAAPTTGHGDLPSGAYSYEFQSTHPNDANLIGIFGKKNLTIEGTGAHPDDVIITAGFVKDVGIRCDRCSGFIARNFHEKNANEHGVYTVDSDGYVYDRVVGSFNKAYELFAFASDNGLMTDCDAYGGGDSGFYLGGAPVTPGRYSQVIQRSKMHHSALGFSGTQGNSVLITDCEVYDNAIGISFDSENSHPNFPQAHAVIEHNNIHDNNFDVYAATADVPSTGPGYNFFRYPVGTGIWIVGGVDNIIRNNRIFNNSRFGVMLFASPAEMPLLAEVHRNSIIDNMMGSAAGNGAGPNSTAFPPGGPFPAGGSDFYWDHTGNDNCWTLAGTEKTDPNPIPGPCPFPNIGIAGVTPPPDNLALLLSCAMHKVPGSNPARFVTNDTAYPCPWGQTSSAPYESSAEAACGDGAIDAEEDCDKGEDEVPPNLGGQTCDSLGHGAGTLQCNPYCQWDFSGCAIQQLPTPTRRPECPAALIPTVTATPTATLAPPTPTATIAPPTATAVQVATATNTTAPTATNTRVSNDSAGCAVGATPANRPGLAPLIVVLAALIWRRRV